VASKEKRENRGNKWYKSSPAEVRAGRTRVEKGCKSAQKGKTNHIIQEKRKKNDTKP